jgi:ribosomal protein S21
VGRKVTVEDGESVDRALWRLRRKNAYEFKRWTKGRYGYFEKPSELRRKAAKMAEVWMLMQKSRRRSRLPDRDCTNSMHLYLRLEDLFARTGPTISAGGRKQDSRHLGRRSDELVRKKPRPEDI